jgi:hypothetical protein
MRERDRYREPAFDDLQSESRIPIVFYANMIALLSRTMAISS